jgi:hypothetical protein
MAIELEVLRSCVLEALRRRPGTQYRTLEIDTASVAGERGLPIRAGAEPHLEEGDLRRYRELVWALVIEGIVAIGMNDANEAWPWLSLSEYGEGAIEAGRITPYDPDGYLTELANQQALDDIERRYIYQALVAFRRNLPDASAVMLGAASEHLVTLLGEAVENTDAAIAATVHGKLDGPVLTLLTWLQQYFSQRRAKLDREVRESLDTTFLGVAALIRAARNDAGHPQPVAVSRDQAFINLRLFVPYRAWVLAVIGALPLPP